MGGWCHDDAPPPPHLLAWGGAMLRRAGLGVQGIDAVATRLTESETMSRITRCQPDVIVLLSSPMTTQSDLPFIRALGARFPSVPLLLIGLATRYLPTELVEAVHMVLVGEPEGALEAACRRLLANPEQRVGLCSPADLGVAGYDAEGHLLDLDTLPPPAWGLFPVARYSYLPVVLGRGCAHGCRYCPAPVTQGTRSRLRGVKRLMEELEQVATWYRMHTVYFSAPLFAVDRVQSEALCAALLQSDLPARLSWHCETRPDLLDLSLLQQMKRAGCAAIHLGLEAVTPEVLIALQRLSSAPAVQQYLTQVRQIIFGCRAFEIECHLHVMAGLPGNRSGAAATRTFLRAYAPPSIHITPLVPYPGTSIFPTNRIDDEIAFMKSRTASNKKQQQQVTARQRGAATR